MPFYHTPEPETESRSIRNLDASATFIQTLYPLFGRYFFAPEIDFMNNIFAQSYFIFFLNGFQTAPRQPRIF